MKLIFGTGEHGLHTGMMGKHPCIIINKNKKKEKVGSIKTISSHEQQIREQRQAIASIAFTNREAIETLMQQLQFIRAQFITVGD